MEVKGQGKRRTTGIYILRYYQIFTAETGENYEKL
jgi:hypothetical protein